MYYALETSISYNNSYLRYYEILPSIFILMNGISPESASAKICAITNICIGCLDLLNSYCSKDSVSIFTLIKCVKDLSLASLILQRRRKKNLELDDKISLLLALESFSKVMLFGFQIINIGNHLIIGDKDISKDLQDAAYELLLLCLKITAFVKFDLKNLPYAEE